MGHAFVLHPDIDLIKKYGYEYICPLEIESIWTEQQRLKLEREFTTLLTVNGLSTHYDTLLYIVLIEHNYADQLFQHYHESYSKYKRLTELSKLLLLSNPEIRHKPVAIKVETMVESIKLTDPTLIKWLCELINASIIELDFIPAKLGEEVFTFVQGLGEDSSNPMQFDYDKITSYASRKIRKPTVRERNKVLAPLLFKILHVVNNETHLCAPINTRFTDNQLIFLYNLATLLEWVDDSAVASEGKDYISALLNNHLNHRNK